jgi:hypothetical protein
MKMIRYLAHNSVYGSDVVSESIYPGICKTSKHPLHLVTFRCSSVRSPHNHGRRTGLTVGNPTNFVFVVPMSKSRGFAELAVFVDEHVFH